MKDHWDGLGRLGRDVAGVAQSPRYCPVAVVELLLGGLEGREALPGGRSFSMERTAWYLSLSRLWCVSLSLVGWHVAAAANGDVAGRGRDGLARRLLLCYVDRAVDLKVREARQGSELCGGRSRLFSGPGSGTFRVRSTISDSTG